MCELLKCQVTCIRMIEPWERLWSQVDFAGKVAYQGRKLNVAYLCNQAPAEPLTGRFVFGSVPRTAIGCSHGVNRLEEQICKGGIQTQFYNLKMERIVES